MTPFLSRSDGGVQITLIRRGILTSVSGTAIMDCKGPGSETYY